jgi:hypothetical protein
MQYFVKTFRIVWRAKNVLVKSIRSGIKTLFASAQYEVNSKLLEVFSFFPVPDSHFPNSLILHKFQHPVAPFRQGDAAPDGVVLIAFDSQRLVVIQGDESLLFQTLQNQAVFLRVITGILQIHRRRVIHPPGNGQEGDLGQLQQHLHLSGIQHQCAGAAAAGSTITAAISASAHTIPPFIVLSRQRQYRDLIGSKPRELLNRFQDIKLDLRVIGSFTQNDRALIFAR